MPKPASEYSSKACRVIIIASVLFSAIAAHGSESQTAEPATEPAATSTTQPIVPTYSCTPTTTTTPRENPYRDWDFVPREILQGEGCEFGPGCEGIYVEPSRDWKDAELDPEGEDVPLRATSGSTEIKGEDVFLADEVNLTKGYVSLTADKAHLNRSTNILTVEGNVTLRQPGMVMRSDHAVINTDTQLGQFQSAHFLDYESGSRTTAELADRIGEQQLELETARYTHCTPDNEVWALLAADLHLDYKTGLGTAKHARVNIQDVPVFYSPWLQFPIDDRRMSGFLWPTFGSSSNSGFEVTVPYYLNIAPNFDMTVAPHYLADRGTMAEGEMRYLNSYGWLTLSGGYLEDDDTSGEDRWIRDAKHRGDYGSYWHSYLNYTEVSDDEYFDDFELASLEVKRATQLEQNVGMFFNSPDWYGEIKAAKYQTINRITQDQYKRLPQITLENSSGGTNFAPDLIFSTELTRFDHSDSLEEGGTFITGDRAYMEAGLSFPMNWTAGFIIPTGKVRHVSYDLDTGTGNLEDRPDTTVPLGTLDMGLFFERETNLGGSSFTQTLEPRLYYFYSEYENQDDNPNFDSNRLTFTYSQLFRDSRFAGNDRLDDANQLSVGVSSRFIRNDDGRETLSMGLGQIYYFEDREIQLNSNVPNPDDTLSSSEIAGELMYQPVDNLWVTGTVIWDHREENMNDANASFHYVSPSRAVYNLGYQFDRDSIVDLSANDNRRDLEQVEVSLALPVGERWQLFGRYQYDIDGEFSLENMAGLQFDSCCWLVRFAFQRAVTSESLNNTTGELKPERDNTFLLEFQLKGLGSVGNKVLDLLQESILGYEEQP